ncbi:MAG: cytochrome c3 family protein, partial [Anaerolineales bacterium]
MPKAFLNPVSYFGLVLATVSLGASAFLLFLHLVGFTQRPYSGILTFFVFPAFLLLGMIIVPVGALWHRRRLRRRGAG